MKISIRAKTLKSIDDGKLDRFGIDMDRINRWNDTTSMTVDLAKLTDEKLKQLYTMIKKSKAFGTVRLAEDIAMWMEIKDDDKGEFDNKLVKQLRYIESLLVKKMQTVNPNRHRIYMYNETHNTHFAYYVSDICYHEKIVNRDWTEPEKVVVRLSWMELGKQKTTTIRIETEHAHWQTFEHCMKRIGFYFETSAMQKKYEESIERYDKIYGRIGEQYLASGSGEENEDGKSNYRWYSSNIALDKEGQPTNVVVDIEDESDKETSHRHKEDSEIDLTWWNRLKYMSYDEDGDEIESTENINEEELKPEELPIHPMLTVFALKKHMRLTIHVDQLVKYKYDKKLGEKLVLPQESSDLIKTLVSYEGGFQDIIKSKGGGAIILCAGIPGTGKTLTAEVYSEVMEMPLYTVQCSQLGTDPDDLEKQLLKVFARAERWHAILLLDEADVYVSERGSNLQQNAIVGVFLRLLEYYRGVLFLTTNRDDLIDDAIASRCIAKIVYDKPTAGDAKRIWRILADIQGVPMTDIVIKQLVVEYPELTGRDIKNLLKLAKLVHKEEGNVTKKTIEFVKRFKPTNEFKR